MLPALIPLIGAGISGAFNYFGAKNASDNTAAANMMNIHMNTLAANQASQNFWANMEAQQGWHADALREAATNRDWQTREAALTRDTNLGINAQNIALQREFAKSGITWRVQDAINAGIHPMAALGGTGASFSPVAHISGGSFSPSSVSSPSPVPSGSFSPAAMSADTHMGTALGNMGQDISRALNAAVADKDRVAAVTTASDVLSLENMKLKNELLKSQIARMRTDQGPAMPIGDRYLIDGQGQAKKGDKLVEVKPLERTPGAPGALHQEPAAITDVGFAKTSSGGYAVIPSKDVKERIEDNFFHETLHFLRNNLAPMLSSSHWSPPKFDAGKGKQWRFNPFTGEYRAEPTRFSERFYGFTGRR